MPDSREAIAERLILSHRHLDRSGEIFENRFYLSLYVILSVGEGSLSLHRRLPSPFGLAQKGPKTQGLELMSGKFVKAFIAASQAAMKNRSIRDALGCGC